jgi:hypothetical protein
MLQMGKRDAFSAVCDTLLGSEKKPDPQVFLKKKGTSQSRSAADMFAVVLNPDACS